MLKRLDENHFEFKKNGGTLDVNWTEIKLYS